jgi:8-oxo-dGTP diphosphatase
MHPVAHLLQQEPALLDCLYLVNVEAAVYHQGRYLMIIRGMNESTAPGTLSFPGGKVERAGETPDILEATLRREIREETGVEVGAELVYVHSRSFIGGNADRGLKPILDLLFLCRYQSGEAQVTGAAEPGEIAGLAWRAVAEVLADPLAPDWTLRDLLAADAARQKLGWE